MAQEDASRISLADVMAKAERVYVCEGEKSVDAARSIGLIATTSAHGAESASKTDWTPLAGKDVVFLPDNDDAGRAYIEDAAAILSKVTPSPTMKIIALPDLPAGGDIVEWIDAHGEATEPEEFQRQIEALVYAAEPFTPSQNGPVAPQQKGLAISRKLSEVQPRTLEWLWPDRIPLGKLVLVAGDPGLGKRMLTLDIAARVTRGEGWPDRPQTGTAPADVILLNAEDDLEDTIRPRLEKAGADLDRVHSLEGIRMLNTETGEESRRVWTMEHLPVLEELLQSTPGVRLVVIDPISAFCGTADSHNNAEVRALLSPLAELASQYNVAVLAITHLAKGAGGKAVYRSMGSLAFTAAARAVWAVTKDPDDRTRRLLLPVKMNLCAESTGLAFTIVEEHIRWEQTPVNMTADDVLASETRKNHDQTSTLEDAKTWLLEELTDGPVPVKILRRRASDDGFSWRTVERAKSALGIVARKEGFGPGQPWAWCLPDSMEPVDPFSWSASLHAPRVWRSLG